MFALFAIYCKFIFKQISLYDFKDANIDFQCMGNLKYIRAFRTISLNLKAITFYRKAHLIYPLFFHLEVTCELCLALRPGRYLFYSKSEDAWMNAWVRHRLEQLKATSSSTDGDQAIALNDILNFSSHMQVMKRFDLHAIFVSEDLKLNQVAVFIPPDTIRSIYLL